MRPRDRVAVTGWWLSAAIGFALAIDARRGFVLRPSLFDAFADVAVAIWLPAGALGAVAWRSRVPLVIGGLGSAVAAIAWLAKGWWDKDLFIFGFPLIEGFASLVVAGLVGAIQHRRTGSMRIPVVAAFAWMGSGLGFVLTILDSKTHWLLWWGASLLAVAALLSSGQDSRGRSESGV